ncbi:MAG: hypothetical protein NUV76_00340 [Candidatus Kuenenia sp.]|nr:hypothetical protein [Candidatus Kuenenia sp.]
MVKQTLSKELSEVKNYKELKSQLKADHEKLAATQERLTKLEKTARELYNKQSQNELEKKKAIERFALDEISSEVLDKIKKRCREESEECHDTMEIIEATKGIIKKQEDALSRLDNKIRNSFPEIWSKIADEFQKQLEASVGETVKLLWVAMLNEAPHQRCISPNGIPERFRIFATPEREEIVTLQEKLWEKFVGNDLD